jgi:hypothetical protein
MADTRKIIDSEPPWRQATLNYDLRYRAGSSGSRRAARQRRARTQRQPRISPTASLQDEIAATAAAYSSNETNRESGAHFFGG